MNALLSRFSGFWLVILTLLSGPAQANGECDDLSGLPINFNVRWAQVWDALNEQTSCTQNCHLGSDPRAELPLGSRDFSIYFLVSQPSAQNQAILRVEAGFPRYSLFFQKISCSRPKLGTPMPPPSGHLPLSLQGLIYDWIQQGAYGESAEDPIARDFVFRDSVESLRQ